MQVGSAARTTVVTSQGLPTVKANMASVLGKRFVDATQPFSAELGRGVVVEGCAPAAVKAHLASPVWHLS